jgi:dCTP deaminase
MSFLNLDQIREALKEGRIIVEPFNENLVRPASVILRLGNSVTRLQKTENPIDPYSEESIKSSASVTEFFSETILNSHEFLIATTFERIGISKDLIGLVSNLSHLARLGLDIHLGSFLIQPGFGETAITTLNLEIFNHNFSPIKLYSEMPVCHVAFVEMGSPATISYDEQVGLYTGQTQPLVSRYYLEFQRHK